MKAFSHVIKTASGLHARPAGLLVRAAESFESTVTVKNGEKCADLKKLISVMALSAALGDRLDVEIEGADEEAALLKIKSLTEEIL